MFKRVAKNEYSGVYNTVNSVKSKNADFMKLHTNKYTIAALCKLVQHRIIFQLQHFMLNKINAALVLLGLGSRPGTILTNSVCFVHT